MSKEETIRKYSDIINTDRPWPDAIIRKHPRMNLLDRAKIFAPFAALSGHGTSLSREDWKVLRTKRIELSDEDTAILSEKLAQVKKHMDIIVVYFELDEDNLGTYTAIDGTVTNVDAARLSLSQ